MLASYWPIQPILDADWSALVRSAAGPLTSAKRPKLIPATLEKRWIIFCEFEKERERRRETKTYNSL